MKKMACALCFLLCAAAFGAASSVSAASHEAPFTLTYERTATAANDAGGVVTITDSPADVSTWYNLYWANESGKLEGYTMLTQLQADGGAEFTIPACTRIPAEATQIRAYSVTGVILNGQDLRSETEVYAQAPIPAGAVQSEELLYEFQVLSDVHLRNGSPTDLHYQRFRDALRDIQTLSPDTSAIFLNGDITDNGWETQWEAYQGIVEMVYGDEKPEIYCSIGNHESIDGQTFEQMFDLFNRFTGASNPYYKVELHGATFLVLSTTLAEIDVSPNYYAYLGEEQRDWLEDELSAAAGKDGPVFVFLHQPLKETVSGSFESRGQTWMGVMDDAELRAILDRYPNVVMFSSHTHWHLESYGAMKYGDGTGPSFFNTAAVGYLWSDEGAYEGGKTYPGSQGLYVEVYPESVVVRGRDFENSAWISAAQFTIPLSSERSGGETGETSSCGSCNQGSAAAILSLLGLAAIRLMRR